MQLSTPADLLLLSPSPVYGPCDGCPNREILSAPTPTVGRPATLRGRPKMAATVHGPLRSPIADEVPASSLGPTLMPSSVRSVPAARVQRARRVLPIALTLAHLFAAKGIPPRAGETGLMPCAIERLFLTFHYNRNRSRARKSLVSTRPGRDSPAAWRSGVGKPLHPAAPLSSAAAHPHSALPPGPPLGVD